MATAEAAALSARATAERAKVASAAHGALTELESALDRTHAVINVDFGFLHQLLSSENILYAPYAKQLEAGIRALAQPDHDQRRAGVEGTLFGTLLGKEILYAALALDGRGLGSYGPVSLELVERMIAPRASVLEDNSYVFVTRQKILAGGAIPPGFRSPWGTRSEVGVAKLAKFVTSTTNSNDHAKLVLSSDGVDRSKDEFMEVHIYGTFDRRAIKRITVLQAPTDPTEAQRLRDDQTIAAGIGIDWSGP